MAVASVVASAAGRVRPSEGAAGRDRGFPPASAATVRIWMGRRYRRQCTRLRRPLGGGDSDGVAHAGGEGRLVSAAAVAALWPLTRSAGFRLKRTSLKERDRCSCTKDVRPAEGEKEYAEKE